MKLFHPVTGLAWLRDSVVLAVLYYVTARLGQLLAIPPGNVTPVWIPSGIILAAVLLRGYRVWPGVFVGAFLGNVWAYFDSSSPLAALASIASGAGNGVGDVLCVVLSAYLIRRTGGRLDILGSAGRFLAFAVYGAALGPAISALFGVTSLCAAGVVPWDQWRYAALTWWTGDGVGVLIITPVICSWVAERRVAVRRVECLAVLAALSGVCAYSVGLTAAAGAVRVPLFGVAPVLIWAVFRCAQRTVSVGVAVVAALSVAATAAGRGPLVSADRNLSLIQLQLFVALVAVTIQFLSAAVAERRDAQEALARAGDDLERRIAERTADLAEANAGLSAAREFTDAALDAQADTFFVFDSATGEAVRWNQAFREVSGYSDDEIRRMKAPDSYYSEEDLERASAATATILAGERVTVEMSLITKRGDRIPTEYTASLVRGRDGRRYIIAVGRDVTERRLAEEARRHSEARFRRLFEQSNDAVALIDLRGRLLDVNQRACEMMACSRDELLSRSALELHPEGDAPRVREAFRTILSEGAARVEARVLRADGAVVDVDISGRLVDRREGLVQAIARDITGRKRAEAELRRAHADLEQRVEERAAELVAANRRLEEEVNERRRAVAALRESHRRLGAIIEGTTDVIFLQDREGRYILGNSALARMFDRPLEKIIGKDNTALFPPETARRLMEVNRRIIASGRPRTSQDTVPVRGQNRVFSVLKAPHYDEQGELIGLVGIARDITEQKQMEGELVRARQLEALGTLAGGIAHDFNNLLTGIRGALSLVRGAAKSDEEVGDMLAIAEKESLRASSLAQQLLTFARGGAPIRKRASLSEITSDSATFALSGSNVRCEFVVPDDLWPADVDEGQMSQVIRNLIRNADDAMPDGGVVRVSAENAVLGPRDPAPVAPGRYVRLSIRDRGPGMREQEIQRAFDPYFTTKDDGTGLGLSVARSIVVDHGGHIAIESQAGAGTTVHIYLPAAAPDGGPASAEEAAPPAVGRGRVLLVDDEPTIIFTQGAILRKLGYDVASARDGHEALSRYRKAKQSGNPFDAVVMDLTLPGGMGGVEVTRRLLEIHADARVVVSSGYSNDPVMANFAEHGFVGVVPKPYTTEQLAQAIDAAMGDLGPADFSS